MKSLIPLLLLPLAGCQATPTPVITATPPTPIRQLPAAPAITPPDPLLERKVRQQAQFIEALISQNEALSARLTANPDSPSYPSPVVRALTKPMSTVAAVVLPVPPPKPEERPALTPNADGVIDVAAAMVAPKSEEAVNPFAVRIVPAESVKEVSLQVGGVVAGPVACAVINDKLLQAGDTIESLTLERIESDAVILRHGTQRMRLPIGAKNLRLRLPI